MKVYLYILVLILLGSCLQESKSKHVTIKTDLSIADTTKSRYTDTLKILCYGEKTPDLYVNVRHILQKKYTVNFIDVAGCEVTTKLIDSVKKCNFITYTQLNKRYNRNVEFEINKILSEEYSYLNKLDSYLRKTQKEENTALLIYYVKKPHMYKAYFLFGQPTEKTLQYRIKSVLEVDSATKKIISRTKKDELLPYNFKQLQND